MHGEALSKLMLVMSEPQDRNNIKLLFVFVRNGSRNNTSSERETTGI